MISYGSTIGQWTANLRVLGIGRAVWTTNNCDHSNVSQTHSSFTQLERRHKNTQHRLLLLNLSTSAFVKGSKFAPNSEELIIFAWEKIKKVNNIIKRNGETEINKGVKWRKETKRRKEWKMEEENKWKQVRRCKHNVTILERSVSFYVTHFHFRSLNDVK